MGDILVHDLSVQAYLLLQEVCINCLKSKYIFVILIDAWGHICSQPIRQVAFWISVAQASWKSESSNVSLVSLGKLLFGFQLASLLGKVN